MGGKLEPNKFVSNSGVKGLELSGYGSVCLSLSKMDGLVSNYKSTSM